MMPNLIDIAPRDVYVLFEMSLEEMLKLELALQRVEIKFDGSVKEERDAADYLSKDFYQFVENVLRKVKNGS